MIYPKGKLVIIGGAVDLGSNMTAMDHSAHPDHIKFFERGILRRIIAESPQQHRSHVEVITTASQIPEIVGQEYLTAFKNLNVSQVSLLDIRSREEAANEVNLERIRKADVVMFSGGDQLKLSAIFGGTLFIQLLKKRYYAGELLIAGIISFF
jgi:cyanophycinase